MEKLEAKSFTHQNLRQSCPKTSSKYIKVVGIRDADNGNQVFLPRYSYKRQEHLEGVWRGFFDWFFIFFFTSTLPWWNRTISSEVLRLMLLLIVATGSHSVLNAGVWTWTWRDAAESKKCKAQSAVLCLSQVYRFYVVIVDVGFVLCSCSWAIYYLENTTSWSSDSQ